jgi:NAD-dependent dihydropyrimidine dehydrogenase PreA subunit
VWIAIGLWTGFTFVGYFTPIHTLAAEAMSLRPGPVGNLLGAVLRLCHLRQRRLHARAGLQVHVPLRALPERHVRQGHADHQLRHRARRAARLAFQEGRPQGLGLGECIDCGLCVQVCPTGIDIRKGLQYECIGCAACVDVCDDVMDKMNYPRGLVRYDTQNGLAQHLTQGQVLRRMFRPRVLIYTGILLLIAWRGHQHCHAHALPRRRGARPRHAGAPGRRRLPGKRLPPADHERHRQPQTYSVKVDGLPGWPQRPDGRGHAGPAEARWVTLRCRCRRTAAGTGPGAHEIHFRWSAWHAGDERAGQLREKSTFVVPR